MPKRTPIYSLACIALIAGCTDTPAPTAPANSLAAARGVAEPLAAGEAGRPVATVRLKDACDPATFAGVPGGCQRNGGMKLDQFIATLTRLQTVPAWAITPPDLFLKEGDEYIAANVGGETHTFTEVDEFGGGIVPLLNQLAGITEVAPECAAITPGEFIPSGGSSPTHDAEPGDEKYQCCIHPWMRMTVHTRS